MDTFERKLELAKAKDVAEQPQKVLSPKAVDELREILRRDEDVREFFILLKNRELRNQAVEKLTQHLNRK